ncbi:phage tail assembly protein [Vibrio sp. YMD68]|uniref:phage tail assembly protein n=1 Tax=Vibrio sp. YMD68 TaxID=3042300 RepID=UPI00249A2932|nr:phage tail assembly protein [Vibrio sp. YMD68]WGV98818.1 phage tail assembly protein [Vibrio sp. YMD68]WGW01255.1 phage tail assembly protein [Vibrio sp. YMD68]
MPQLEKRTVPFTYPVNGMKEVTLRKPLGGDYRGLSFKALDNLDMDEVFELLTRISPLTKAELDEVHPCDIRKLCEALTLFFSEDLPQVSAFLMEESTSSPQSE